MYGTSKIIVSIIVFEFVNPLTLLLISFAVIVIAIVFLSVDVNSKLMFKYELILSIADSDVDIVPWNDSSVTTVNDKSFIAVSG